MTGNTGTCWMQDLILIGYNFLLLLHRLVSQSEGGTSWPGQVKILFAVVKFTVDGRNFF